MSIVGNVEITNYATYNYNMSLSVSDKLFFLDKVDFDVIVDFGCADGILLEELSKLKPDVRLIGYDIDSKELSICRDNIVRDNIPNVFLTSEWSEVVREISKYKSPLLNLSSVIHEVYSYSTLDGINSFWNDIFHSNFRYIVIRDMMPSKSIDGIDISEYYNDIDKVISGANSFYLESFESTWGSIRDSYRNFVHYLLKYRYEINWDREVLENYLPICIEDVLEKIPDSYGIMYRDHFIVPFIKDQTYKDFGITMDRNTHSKLILERCGYKG